MNGAPGFDELVSALGDRLRRPLPADAAHARMRATPVGSALPRFEHKLPAKAGSVLLLIYPDQSGRIRFPLIKRPDYLGTHSGQVSLPGGKAEPGEDYMETALREGEEEVGIRRSDLKVLGRLSDHYVIPSNFLVTTVVAAASNRPFFVPDPTEVVRILEGDLHNLVPEEAIRTKEITAGGRYQMMAPHFEIDGEVVWGATAMILNEFRMIYRELIGCDAGR